MASPLLEEDEYSDGDEETDVVTELLSTLALSSVTRSRVPLSRTQQPAAEPSLTDDLATLTLGSDTVLATPRRRAAASAELQVAIKYGTREPASPSKKGQPRVRVTFGGVVYVIDAATETEVTRWRLDDNADAEGPPVFGALAGFASHFVFVVDSSGSMRKDDVAGHHSRTHAVYDMLRREFLQPQLDLMAKSGLALGDAQVSLIDMGSTSAVVLNRVPVDEGLAENLAEMADEYAHGHGNYVPALQKLTLLLEEDVKRQVKVVVFFLSDGAPSDHTFRECPHGVAVWQQDDLAEDLFFSRASQTYKQRLQSCGRNVTTCRRQLHEDVQRDCCDIVRALGERFGFHRFQLCTVAFGNPQDSYRVLEQMAKVHANFSFQKLGLAAHRLGMVFSSLSTTLTTMRTSSVGHGGLTLRAPRERESARAVAAVAAQEISADKGWDVYTYADRNLMSKKVYDPIRDEFVFAQLVKGAHGVAIRKKWFAQGSERSAYICTEVGPAESATSASASASATPARTQRPTTLVAKDTLMVAKDSLFEEDLLEAKFHHRIAKDHAKGQELAVMFNARVAKLYGDRAGLAVSFAPCWLYEVFDPRYPSSVAWILAEPRLDGRYTKWNNNAGRVASRDKAGLPVDGVEQYVPQAFSHFTWSVTDGRELLCDLQGVWNLADGFVFTDPARHSHELVRGKKKRRRRTDKGSPGMRAFFETHECSVLCRGLGLKPYPTNTVTV